MAGCGVVGSSVAVTQAATKIFKWFHILIFLEQSIRNIDDELFFPFQYWKGCKTIFFELFFLSLEMALYSYVLGIYSLLLY
jgi:hypothetical protein